MSEALLRSHRFTNRRGFQRMSGSESSRQEGREAHHADSNPSVRPNQHRQYHSNHKLSHGRMRYQGVFPGWGELQTLLDNPPADPRAMFRETMDIWWDLQGLLGGILG